MALSHRLQQLDNMVSPGYHHVWDCCCDHGFLGFTLLTRGAANTIHFVDIVPELMAELDGKLQRFYSNAIQNTTRWNTHCIDVTELPLTQYQGKHLIIIAGVGGDLMIKFIEALVKRHKGLALDFLLCPVHHQFSLRNKLIEMAFSLQDEILVEDNKRFYEMLLVSTVGNELKKVSPVGDKIWQPLKYRQAGKPNNLEPSQHSSKEATIAQQYLAKTLNHYYRIQQGKTNDVQYIIDAYNAISSD